LLRQHGWGYDYLDAAMLEAIERVLAQRGSRAASQAVDLLLRYHAVESARQELLDPPRYLWEPLERFYSDVMQHADLPERACYRSPWPRSGFCLVSKGTRTLALTLIARLPRLPGTEHDYAGEARLSLNGHNLGSLDLHTHWTTHQVNVPRAAIKRGLNRLVIHWPPLPAFGAEVSRAVIACLDRGIEAPLHPIFGELFSVQVQ
jgi:hypothetical protein